MVVVVSPDGVAEWLELLHTRMRGDGAQCPDGETFHGAPRADREAARLGDPAANVAAGARTAHPKGWAVPDFFDSKMPSTTRSREVDRQGAPRAGGQRDLGDRRTPYGPVLQASTGPLTGLARSKPMSECMLAPTPMPFVTTPSSAALAVGRSPPIRPNTELALVVLIATPPEVSHLMLSVPYVG